MALRRSVFVVACLVVVPPAIGDELLYRYEGDVFPFDESAGWVIFNPCETPCSESVEDSHFVLRWPQAGDLVNYTLIISNDLGEPPLPPTLWVEWRFRSSCAIGPNFFSGDADFTIRYREIFDWINMYGDAVISAGGGSAVFDLPIDEFHTYRFESLDGVNYRISVDGQVFIDATDIKMSGGAFLQMGGGGVCDTSPNTTNEWDFVRYGTISSGEQIIASDPPAGFLNPVQYAGLDRFTVTFDSPNYVYLDEITVEVTGGVAPVITQTRRRENNEPDTVEIVLDRSLTIGETTTFTFNDGTAVNVIEYTLSPPIPAVSTWGVIAMALLLLIAGTIVLARRPAAKA